MTLYLNFASVVAPGTCTKLVNAWLPSVGAGVPVFCQYSGSRVRRYRKSSTPASAAENDAFQSWVLRASGCEPLA